MEKEIQFTTHYSRLTKAAFTLAETLIVIGIIGVVAALTLPNLNHATGDKEKVTKVKKIYSALTDAFDRAQVIYGNYDEWFEDLNDNTYANYIQKSERFAKRVTEFMKVSKDCGVTSNNSCRINSNFSDTGSYSVMLSDGMALNFLGRDGEWGCILVDIDGLTKGKNQDGNDIFAFDIFENQLYPGGGGMPEYSDDDKANYCLNMNYCADWVVEFGNMEYLKADHGVCPNGGQLSWTSTDCSTATATPADDDNDDDN